LAAGCTVVLKPSEGAPLSSLLLAEMVDEAGLPAGVFNLVNGVRAGVETQLATHPEVDRISFTGSSRAGTATTRASADSVKRVTLELGGKGANVVFADADAVRRGVATCMDDTGHSCDAPTRMLVERSVYDRALQAAEWAATATKVAPASEQGDHIGPLVSEIQWDKVQGLIQIGMDEGARLVAGGPGCPEG
jgi:aldehyde dehydrogenase (NAD+)